MVRGKAARVSVLWLVLALALPEPPARAEDDPAAAEATAPEVEGAGFGDFAELDLESLLKTPVVEAASRRAQSWLDAPASITQLDSQALGSVVGSNPAEALRRVPGLHLLQDGRTNYNVGIRGINGLFNNRVLLLVDGVLGSDRLIGRQLWSTLPLHTQDIEKIEIIRGPGSTLYGADALSGVISITTRRPLDRQGLSAEAWGGLDIMAERPLDPGRAWAAGAGGAHLAYAWANPEKTLGVRLSTFLQHTQDTWDLSDRYLHAPYQYGVLAHLQYRPQPDLELSLRLGHGESEYYFVGAKAYTVSHGHNQMVSLSLEKKRLFWDWLDLEVSLDARRVFREYDTFDSLDSSEQGAFSAAFVSGADISDDVHGQLQLTASLWDGRSVTTVGGEVTYFLVEEFYESNPSLLFMGLVLHNETSFLDDRSLLLSVGGRFEQIQAQEDEFGEITYRHISPRVALVWRFAELHSLRLSGSSAYRTPQPYETLVDVKIPAAVQGDPPVRLLVGNPQLAPEQLYGLELGYRGLLFDMLRVDATLFLQRISGIIGDERENMSPVIKKNLFDLDQAGVELGLVLNPTTWASAHLSYAFTYSRDAGTHEQLRDWPVHLWSLGTELRLPARMRLNLDAQLVFDYRPTVDNVQGVGSGYPQLVWLATQSADGVWVDLRLGKFLFEDRVEVFLAVDNLAGFWRDEDGNRAHPSQYSQPVPGTVLLGLRATGW